MHLNMANNADKHDHEQLDNLAQHLNNISFEEEYNRNRNDDSVESDIDDDPNESDLPNTLIITNVDDSVYDEIEARNTFECLFREHGLANFQYLKSFRRVRVEYRSSVDAAKAHITLHETELFGKRIKCYFAQPVEKLSDGSPHLQIPPPHKQFLISPPASPPIGWEPHPEAEPVIDYDLLAALATLAPGESHELHPASESAPGIVVHICEDPDGFENRPKIEQTRRPEFR